MKPSPGMSSGSIGGRSSICPEYPLGKCGLRGKYWQSAVFLLHQPLSSSIDSIEVRIPSAGIVNSSPFRYQQTMSIVGMSATNPPSGQLRPDRSISPVGVAKTRNATNAKSDTIVRSLLGVGLCWGYLFNRGRGRAVVEIKIGLRAKGLQDRVLLLKRWQIAANTLAFDEVVKAAFEER